MNIKTSTENRCGITWECFTPENEQPSYFTGETFCIDYNKKDNCFSLWDGLDCVFESPVRSLVFMVARELILENFANGFIPSWKVG